MKSDALPPEVPNEGQRIELDNMSISVVDKREIRKDGFCYVWINGNFRSSLYYDIKNKTWKRYGGPVLGYITVKVSLIEMTKTEKQAAAMRSILRRSGLTADTVVEAIQFMLEEDIAPQGRDIDDMLRQFIKA